MSAAAIFSGPGAGSADIRNRSLRVSGSSLND
jgi:hypothetical protein